MFGTLTGISLLKHDGDMLYLKKWCSIDKRARNACSLVCVKLDQLLDGLGEMSDVAHGHIVL